VSHLNWGKRGGGEEAADFSREKGEGGTAELEFECEKGGGEGPATARGLPALKGPYHGKRGKDSIGKIRFACPQH